MNNDQLNTSEPVVTEDKTAMSRTSPTTIVKKKWNTDRLMTYIAFLISIGTFITFTYQTHLIQKQQFRSVLPYLIVTTHSDYTKEGQRIVGLQLFNNGVGPAVIENVKITYAGKEYTSIYDFFIKGIYSENKISTGRTDVKAGYAIPTGQYVDLLFSNDSQASTVLEKVFNSPDFTFEIIYSSLYDEKWKIIYKNKDYNPKPVKLD